MSSPDEVMEVIDEGKANRHVAVTSELKRFFVHSSSVRSTAFQLLSTMVCRKGLKKHRFSCWYIPPSFVPLKEFFQFFPS